jgi:hypothetical protein
VTWSLPDRHESFRYLIRDRDQTFPAHPERVLGEFQDHYNGHRPNRALNLTPPDRRLAGAVRTDGQFRVRRRDRLGGVIHEYTLT